ncbi:MAG: polysaccharide deacetylase family protein [Elusimicrobiota bacterium]|jgi:peptidoglycan/xylan/chitin deacetylase (PgdA/CDA1 family)
MVLLLASSSALAYTPGRFYAVGHTQEKVIALTFDDGPGPITPPVLDFLKSHRIRATFFMEGTQVERYPKFVRDVATAGHEIGNHTYWHFDYHKLKHATPERLIHELRQTESSLRRALHNPRFRTQVVRMPYGYFNRRWLLPALKSEKYALVHWSYEKEGVPEMTSQQMAQAYIDHAKPGAIFLFHDGGRRREKTFETMKTVITTLETQGYRFVAAEDLLKE